MRHEPVLLRETIEALALAPGKHVIDCTLGDGGHSQEILTHTAPDGRLLGLDADPESLLRAKHHLNAFADRALLVRSNFEALARVAAEKQFAPVHGVLFDLGWSSPQFEERGRGFSFQKNAEPLDMRFDPSGQGNTAADFLSEMPEEEIARVLRQYGEEKFAKQIASEVVRTRIEKRIETVGDFVEIILSVYRTKLRTDADIPWVGGLHPATKSFQALRIMVNDELGVLESALLQAIDLVQSGGRVAVISFHSLEDRIVKHTFKKAKHSVRVVTKKPVICGKEEWDKNPRARSAKLRVIEKL